ncbi:MAG: transcription termination/antitermination protein NusG [Candidatus Binatia bacterium]
MNEQRDTAVCLEIENGQRWYTIRTKPRKEGTVEKRLKDLKLEVFLPWIRARRRIGTRHQWILEPLFPGYLFCHVDLLLAGKVARYSPGVKDFVRFGNRIPAVTEEVIHNLLARCPDGVAQIGPRPYRAGEALMIKEGPLSGLDVIFEREMRGVDRVAVLLDLLGRQTRLILRSEMVARI